MGRVNNAAYLDYAEEGFIGLPNAARLVTTVPRHYRLEYLAAPGRGEPLVGLAWEAEAGAAYRLLASGGAELLRAVISG